MFANNNILLRNFYFQGLYKYKLCWTNMSNKVYIYLSLYVEKCILNLANFDDVMLLASQVDITKLKGNAKDISY